MEYITDELHNELIMLRERVAKIKESNRKGFKKFRLNHPEKISEYHKQYKKNKYHTDPEYKEQQKQKSRVQAEKKKQQKLNDALVEKLEKIEI